MTDEQTATAAPEWCKEKQIYINGIIPSSNSNTDVESLLKENNGSFRIFGYGSLCWNPGTPLSNVGITKSYGRAIGWKRCWCQRSADHRGTTSFLGLVCTLLSDEEYLGMVRADQGTAGTTNTKDEGDGEDVVSMTEGVIYTVPESVANEVLQELDFREKGGYSRDVIDVIEDETNRTAKALLYRGTPENPAFWKRALLDLPFAAAIMSVAIGPSGRNDAYLNNLNTFLTNHTTTTSINDDSICSGDVDTRVLATYCKQLQDHTIRYFLYNCGSNQYGQILLYPAHNKQQLQQHPKNVDGDVMEITESVLVVPKEDNNDKLLSSNPIALYAGGGHSALLIENGMLYLWGCNDQGQLGRRQTHTSTKEEHTIPKDVPYPMTQPLQNISVQKAALGFSHTLIIENDTGYVYAFGDNARGQVSGTTTTTNNYYSVPSIPSLLKDTKCIDISAGLFHSAVITEQGELITFGHTVKQGSIWKPADGSRLTKVSCGRKHTIVLDEYGRVYSFGDNKYGQLGRMKDDDCNEKEPILVDGILGEKGSGCFHIDCGWSHNIVMVEQNITTTSDLDSSSSRNNIQLYGWGRNDKGQLGLENINIVSTPHQLQQTVPIKNIHDISCGSEYSMLLTKGGILYSCGWNEHGNLGHTTTDDSFVWKEVIESYDKIKRYYRNEDDAQKGNSVLFAAGGAHFLSIMS